MAKCSLFPSTMGSWNFILIISCLPLSVKTSFFHPSSPTALRVSSCLSAFSCMCAHATVENETKKSFQSGENTRVENHSGREEMMETKTEQMKDRWGGIEKWLKYCMSKTDDKVVLFFSLANPQWGGRKRYRKSEEGLTGESWRDGWKEMNTVLFSVSGSPSAAE